MAVQQNKPTRSKRGMRRSHDALRLFDISISKDVASGEMHRRHYITRDGFYRGRKIFVNKITNLKKDI